MPISPSAVKPAPVMRRLMSMMYDWMLLVALLFLASILPIVAAGMDSNDHPLLPLYYVYVYACAYLFYAWFWTHGGQTLGLRSWRLQVINSKQPNQGISWWQAFKRYTLAWVYLVVLMIGVKGQLNDNVLLMWGGYGGLLVLIGVSWFRPSKNFFHDDASGTHLVLLPKHTNAPSDLPDAGPTD